MKLSRIFKRYSKVESRPLLTEHAPRTFVPRDDLRTLIARALNRPHDLTSAERSKIVHFAETAHVVAYGDWVVEGTGCPVDQCGISRCLAGGAGFASNYDSVVNEYLQDRGYQNDILHKPHILVII